MRDTFVGLAMLGLLAACGYASDSDGTEEATPTMEAPKSRPTTVLQLGKTQLIRANENLEGMLGTGFNPAEEGGAWTVARQSLLNLHLAPEAKNKALRVSIDAMPFLFSSILNSQSVSISSGGKTLFTHVFTQPHISETITFEISADLTQADVVALALDIPNATAPKDVGQSEDLRPLGIFVKSITVNSATAAVTSTAIPTTTSTP